MPRLLFTPRWILVHVIVLLIVAGCVVAGFWQLDRLGERRDFNARVDRQLTLAPQPLDQVITPGSRIDPEAVAYRRVEVEGTYDPSRKVVLVGRSLDDQSGKVRA
jgi:cytochrome oxidase assembly protein ShyY1